MVPALELLPAELWDAIFGFVADDEELLSLAEVCQVFNARCIRLYLMRRDTSLDALLTETQTSVSSDTLIALALYSPLALLPIEELTCEQLGDSHNLLRLFACLDNIILRSPNLHVLSASFHNDFFAIPRSTREIGLSRLCRTLALFASHNSSNDSAPVCILTPHTMFSCAAKDMANWNLGSFQYNPLPTTTRRWYWNRTMKQPEPELRPLAYITKTRLYDGRIADIPTILGLSCVEARLVPSSNELSPTSQSPWTWSSSLVTFDPSSIRYISISPDIIQTASQHCVDSVLAHARLPAVFHLYLQTTVDPARLRRFLEHHPRLGRIEYSSREGTIFPALQPLVDPPLVHPSLEYVKTDLRSAESHSLVAGLVDSPNIRAYEFALAAFPTPAQTDRLFSDLRFISTRSLPNATHLYLVFTEPPLYKLWQKERYTRSRARPAEWADDPIALEIAQGLNCLRTVDLTFSSVATARRLLGWLGALPRVEQITFKLSLRYSRGRSKVKQLSQQEIRFAHNEFLREALEALPHVPSVVCSAN
ncbi:hypothetical protein C8F01DRAFT_443786 [Mycena amicta]|nr:hypothetical protein C8F01DRAFT_443786 [Mycena amicta]